MEPTPVIRLTDICKATGIDLFTLKKRLTKKLGRRNYSVSPLSVEEYEALKPTGIFNKPVLYR